MLSLNVMEIKACHLIFLDVGSHEDADDEEGMGEAYEEISDEEVLEDESFLVNSSFYVLSHCTIPPLIIVRFLPIAVVVSVLFLCW